MRALMALALLISVSAVAAEQASNTQTTTSTPPSAAPVTEAPIVSREEILKVRDPFQMPASVRELSAQDVLERYPIEQIKLVGIVTGPEHMKAMIATPDGKTHLVTHRMRVGNRKGIVTRINEDSIIVRERVINVLGQEEAVSNEIRMADEEVKKKQ